MFSSQQLTEIYSEEVSRNQTNLMRIAHDKQDVSAS
jgi:hypothetical protein